MMTFHARKDKTARSSAVHLIRILWVEQISTVASTITAMTERLTSKILISVGSAVKVEKTLGSKSNRE